MIGFGSAPDLPPVPMEISIPPDLGSSNDQNKPLNLRTVFFHAFWRIYANFSLVTPSNTHFGLIYANFCPKWLITQIFPDPPLPDIIDISQIFAKFCAYNPYANTRILGI